MTNLALDKWKRKVPGVLKMFTRSWLIPVFSFEP